LLFSLYKNLKKALSEQITLFWKKYAME
jgi:hypothetical protein